MPSNSMYACLDCRVGGKAPMPACLRDNHRIICLGTRITVPKKTNDRAWKRIENGEWRWNRRKTKASRTNAQTIADRRAEYKRKRGGRISWGRTGSYTELPNVDLGA